MATDGRLQAFWYVTVPMAAPGLMATAIFTFWGAWNEYIVAPPLTSTPEAQTTTVLIVPAVVFIRFMQRYLIQGLTMGAVKE